MSELKTGLMKRVLFPFLLLFIFSGCEDADPSPNSTATASEYRLIKILNYRTSSSPEPYNFIDMTYNGQSELITESLYDYPNTLVTYTDYEYNGSQKIKKLNYDGQVGNLQLGTFIEYNYSNNNLIKEDLFLGNGTLKFRTHYEYSGNKLVDTFKEGDGLGIHHRYRYTYDFKGRLIRERVFMYNDELENFTEYSYDDHDRVIKSELYDRNSALQSSIEKQYNDDDDLPDRELYFDALGNMMSDRKMTYDQYGHQTEVTVTDQGATHKLVSRKYDGELLIEEITYHPYFGYAEWTVTRYEYEKI